MKNHFFKYILLGSFVAFTFICTIKSLAFEGSVLISNMGGCGGTAELIQKKIDNINFNQLLIKGVTNCSNIYVNGEYKGKLDQFNDGSVESSGTEILFPISEGVVENTVDITSDDGKISKRLDLTTFDKPEPDLIFDFGWFSHVLSASQNGKLNKCGGYIKVDVLENNVNVELFDVKHCRKFKIPGWESGHPVVKFAERLDRHVNNTYSKKFAIPHRLIRDGSNSFKIILSSNGYVNSPVREVILINFKAKIRRD